ncbi:hypothetical protein [uncultured Akkermansia sp.]|uniref:hypothetical protein n=1 Tax=uncultured Akkermansia sp. TaxID=512294 RepID=UPI0025E1E39D|nr:hypothetical protein [uncultured Akkermansia sp.]
MEMPDAEFTTWEWEEKLLGRFIHAGEKGRMLRCVVSRRGRAAGKWVNGIDKFQSIFLIGVYGRRGCRKGHQVKKERFFIKRHPAASRILGFSFSGRDGLIGPCWLKELFRVWT